MTVKKECITFKGEKYFSKIKKKRERELNILQQSERKRGGDFRVVPLERITISLHR